MNSHFTLVNLVCVGLVLLRQCQIPKSQYKSKDEMCFFFVFLKFYPILSDDSQTTTVKMMPLQMNRLNVQIGLKHGMWSYATEFYARSFITLNSIHLKNHSNLLSVLLSKRNTQRDKEKKLP